MFNRRLLSLITLVVLALAVIGAAAIRLRHQRQYARPS